jgi:lysophospholipase L1-like esterase
MFTTTVSITQSAIKIDHNSKLITLGSCFSEHIGKKLANACFEVESNPFGVLFNPVSIRNSLVDLLDDKKYTQEDLFTNNSLWNSFSHSTLFSSVDQDICLQNINTRLDVAAAILKEADFILITFGTAWVYELKEEGRVVANCHKLPAEKFIRRRLSVEDIVNDYSDLLNKIKAINPKTEVIFTVSPVRHWKDGAHENNISKGILHLAIDNLIKQFDFLHYFPAYEILLDELRDYRYYAEDMLHPSEQAVKYIWERFSSIYFTGETININKQLDKFRNMLNHRVINQDSKESLSFKQKVEEEKSALIRSYPFLTYRL